MYVQLQDLVELCQGNDFGPNQKHIQQKRGINLLDVKDNAIL